MDLRRFGAPGPWCFCRWMTQGVIESTAGPWIQGIINTQYKYYFWFGRFLNNNPLDTFRILLWDAPPVPTVGEVAKVAGTGEASQLRWCSSNSSSTQQTNSQTASNFRKASTVELHGLGLTEWHLHLKMLWLIWPYTDSYLPFRGGDHQLTPWSGLAAVETSGIYVHPNLIWNLWKALVHWCISITSRGKGRGYWQATA